MPVGYLRVDEIFLYFLGVPDVDSFLESPDDSLLAVNRIGCVSLHFSQIVLEGPIKPLGYRGCEESAGDGI